MTLSPLQFARDFEKLKVNIGNTQTSDLQLLLLLDFWPDLSGHKDEPAFKTYWDEYHSLLTQLVTEDNLIDLTIEELQRLFGMLSSIKIDNSQLQNTAGKILAQKLFFVGAIEDGLDICGKMTGGQYEDIPRDKLIGLNEFEAFRIICEHFREKEPGVYEILRHILIEWEGERESVNHEGANCLFVEKDNFGRSYRGRLRVLEGKVELFGKSATTDELTFENQIKAPDDPFIGVAYDSLKAVKKVFRMSGFTDNAKSFYHAHFSIQNSRQTFTGDSIGLAVGLIAYIQLLRPEILRQDRFISTAVAFTGGVDEDGRMLPVNEETLSLKVERAFFSPVKYLVIPEDSFNIARQYIEKLKKKYPRRNLILVTAERIIDVIENRNVIREEKVCITEFVAKKAYKYSRAVKIQVPMLMIITYALICLLFPKAWIGFDWNPEYVTLTKTGFIAMNADSTALWSEEYECDLISSNWKVGDINGNGKNEVVFIPQTNSACSCNVNLFVYDYEGGLLFRRHIAIVGEYPGDTTLFQSYNQYPLKFIKYQDDIIILTMAVQCMPARSHIKFWSATGDLLGWYINSGTVFIWQKVNEIGICEELIFYGINNRMGSACLFVLPRDSCFGVSPPYSNVGYDLSWVKRGNQLKYLIFPQSDYGQAINRSYNSILELNVEGHNVIAVAIEEDNPENHTHLYYSLDSNLRVIDVKASDPFIDHRKDLVDEDKLPPANLTDYLADLRDAVMYWTDSGWVTEGQLRATEK